MMRRAALAVAGIALVMSSPVQADVKEGVDAWARGDYDAAIAVWQPLANSGDADAQFNLAQAYRLGRGVPNDLAKAEELYAAAAANGHIRAADTYGLLLFQAGRHEEALPFIQSASRRGDPRSQYLLGIAHFNGDLVPKDWVRAYALLTLANSEGLPQAQRAIGQMDEHITMADRQAAATLAGRLRADANATRARELAAAELAGQELAQADLAVNSRNTSPTPRERPVARNPGPVSITSRPARVRTAQAPVDSASVVAARNAVAEASRVTGTESPAEAGADFARPTTSAPALASAPTPAAPVAAQVSQPAPVAQTARSGPWQVQLGAFSVAGNADRLWAKLSSRPELAGTQKVLRPGGGVTRLRAGGFATRAEAQRACNALKASGQGCLVTK